MMLIRRGPIGAAGKTAASSLSWPERTLREDMDGEQRRQLAGRYPPARPVQCPYTAGAPTWTRTSGRRQTASTCSTMCKRPW
ncbi:hypothetical protein IG631_05337 [Alternaria alternata]|nr:hypothetical protein IG631_05337 [Alternaria alternata]